MAVTEYFTKFKRLWDQLLNYELIPVCTCGTMKTLSAAHEKTHVMRFLMGLNEHFETIRSQILLYEPFPSLSKVYSLVLQEESHKNIGHGGLYSEKPYLVAMYVNSMGNNSGNKGCNKRERPLCTHCNMLGHTVDKCYKLHGYLPGYKPKGRSNANSNQVSYNQNTTAENFSTGSIQCPIFKAQCEQLLAFFNNGSSPGDSQHVANVSTSEGPCSLEHNWSG
ncbi:hypothetical protein ACB092_12G004400 [Castanea dentata]